MMQAFDVVKELVKMGLTGVEINYYPDRDVFSYNLNTGAKSGLELFDDFHVEGRYSYENNIDSDQDIQEVIEDLFWEFKGCLHGRDFYNSEWMEIGVKLGLIEKKVETTTIVSYE